MERHGVARLVFVNKVDKAGADPVAAAASLADSLGLRPVLLQLPWGTGSELRGVVDVVRGVALSFEGEQGRTVVEHPVPEGMAQAVAEARDAVIDAATLVDDGLAEAVLEGRAVADEAIVAALRAGTIGGALHPVLLGSAYRNVGVQPLLDAAVAYLPAPDEVERTALTADGTEVPLDGDDPVAFAFKVSVDAHGKLVWLRLLRGGLATGVRRTVQRTGRTVRIGRLGRLHGGKLEPIESAGAGDIVAAFGLDAVTGDTLFAGTEVRLGAFELPEPVVEATLRYDGRDRDKLSRAVGRLLTEDPTLRLRTDPESGELRLRGLGELHLQVAVERLQVEHGVTAALGRPTVSFRRRIRRRVAFDHLHRKQSGGPGQYARVRGFLEPLDGDELAFDWRVRGGEIPEAYRSSVERGFLDLLEAGLSEGIPVLGVRVVVDGGATHANDSSEQAFAVAAQDALRGCFSDAEPELLEPAMAVTAEAGSEHHGALLGAVLARRGQVTDSLQDGRVCRVQAEVPLAELFGFSSALRSATAGTGEHSVRFSRYVPAP